MNTIWFSKALADNTQLHMHTSLTFTQIHAGAVLLYSFTVCIHIRPFVCLCARMHMFYLFECVPDFG